MSIINEGDNQSFSYTGNIQTFTVPFNGLYKFELCGAKGGNETAGNVAGANGAKVISYHELKKDTILYVVCGGVGGNGYAGWNNSYNAGAAGYNGGGAGYVSFGNNYNRSAGGGGGGATHIATVDGLIDKISQENMLAVAGGGAGSGWRAYYSSGNKYASYPGYTESLSNNVVGKGTGGTVTSYSGGGGGGYFGGQARYSGTNKMESLTYENVEYTSSNTQGANSGNGTAIITLIKKEKETGKKSIYLGNNKILSPIYHGDREIVGVYFGDKCIYGQEKKVEPFYWVQNSTVQNGLPSDISISSKNPSNIYTRCTIPSIYISCGSLDANGSVSGNSGSVETKGHKYLDISISVGGSAARGGYWSISIGGKTITTVGTHTIDISTLDSVYYWFDLVCFGYSDSFINISDIRLYS